MCERAENRHQVAFGSLTTFTAGRGSLRQLGSFLVIGRGAI